MLAVPPIHAQNNPPIDTTLGDSDDGNVTANGDGNGGGSNGDTGPGPGGGTLKDSQDRAEPAVAISDAMPHVGGSLRFRVTLNPPARRAAAFQAARCPIGQAFSGAPPARLTQALNNLLPPSRARSLPRSRAMSLERLLGNLSVALRSGGRADGGRRLTAWSCGEFPRLVSGGGDRGVAWEGAMANPGLGAHLAIRPGMLAGLSLSRSSGSFDYRTNAGGVPVVRARELRAVGAVSHSDAGARVNGDYERRMVRALPHLARAVPRGVQVRRAIGLGRGTLRTEDDPGGALRSRDTAPSSGAGGVSARLFQRGRSTVKLEGEAGLARFRVAARDLVAESSGMPRLKLATDASQEFALPPVPSLAPRGEVGLRHDGGEGETGAAIEIGARLSLSEAVKGWTVDGFPHRPMTPARELPRQWGFGALFIPDRDPSGRGPSARLTRSWERIGSGLYRHWNEENAGGPSEPVPEPRLEVQIGYGFGAFGGRATVTPFGALGLGGESGPGYRAGVRIYSGPAASLSLEVERREPRHSAPEHAAILRGRLRF